MKPRQMRHRHTALAFLLLICIGASAQGKRKLEFSDRFRNEVGVSIVLIHNPLKDGVSPAFGAYYNPMFTFVEIGPDFSFSVDVPLTVGAHIETSFLPSTFFYGHFPVLVEGSFGHYSTKRFFQPIGLGVAAGYGGEYTDKGFGHGIVFSAAARSWFIKNSSITIRYMFHFNMAGELGYNSHHIMVAGNLGRFFEKLSHMNKISKMMSY